MANYTFLRCMLSLVVIATKDQCDSILYHSKVTHTNDVTLIMCAREKDGRIFRFVRAYALLGAALHVLVQLTLLWKCL